MKLEIESDCLRIIPENPQDKAYLELKCGIKKFGDKMIGEYRPHFGYRNSRAVEFRQHKQTETTSSTTYISPDCITETV